MVSHGTIRPEDWGRRLHGGRCLETSRCPKQERATLSGFRRAALTSLMIPPRQSSSPTVAPFVPRGLTLEPLLSPKREPLGRLRHRRFLRPFRYPYRSELPWPSRDGVGLSPVSVASPCVQARPPVTPSVRADQPYPVAAREGLFASQCFRRSEGLAHRRGRIVAPPELSLLGPSVLGCCHPKLAAYPSQGRFGQGFPHGYGPARVGLDRSIGIGRTVCRTQPPTPAVHAASGSVLLSEASIMNLL